MNFHKYYSLQQLTSNKIIGKKVLFICILCVIIQITFLRASWTSIDQLKYLRMDDCTFNVLHSLRSLHSDFLQFESLKDFDRKNLDPFKKIWILQRKNFFKIYWNPIKMTSEDGRPPIWPPVASFGWTFGPLPLFFRIFQNTSLSIHQSQNQCISFFLWFGKKEKRRCA